MPTAITGQRLPSAYWRLWWAAAIDNVGDGAFAAAVPLMAVTITQDPRTISVIAACTYLPWLLLSLPAGALVDRRDRVGLMRYSQATQAVIVGVVTVLAALGEVGIPALAAAALALGACEVVFGNASQAVLPDLVPAALLHRANGNLYTVTTVGQLFVGPPLGSLLFGAGVAVPFGANAASFVLSAALLSTLPRRRPAHQEPQVRRGVVDGLRWLMHHRLLRTLALLLGVNTFCFQLGNVTVVLLATRTLHISERGYGLLLAGAALGSILGGLVNARAVTRLGPLTTLVAALGANTVIFVGIGLSPNAIVLGGLLTLNGFATSLWSVGTLSLRQQIVPPTLMGRVNSVYRMLGWGLMPLGALAGGFVAHRFGLRSAFPIAGALRGIALIAALPVLCAALRPTANAGTSSSSTRSSRAWRRFVNASSTVLPWSATSTSRHRATHTVLSGTDRSIAGPALPSLVSERKRGDSNPRSLS